MKNHSISKAYLPRTKPLTRLSFLVLLLLASCVTEASGTGGTGGSTGDQGSTGGQVDCPSFLSGDYEGEPCPTVGQVCHDKSGDMCFTWDIVVTCTPEGTWKKEKTTIVDHCCPTEMPVEGSDCSGLIGDYVVCPYSVGPSCPGGMEASCIFGSDTRWHLDLSANCDPCAQYTSASECAAGPLCRWIVPASSGPLQAPGCFAGLECDLKDTCMQGKTCQAVDIMSCEGNGCTQGQAHLCL